MKGAPLKKKEVLERKTGGNKKQNEKALNFEGLRRVL